LVEQRNDFLVQVDLFDGFVVRLQFVVGFHKMTKRVKTKRLFGIGLRMRVNDKQIVHALVPPVIYFSITAKKTIGGAKT
jgi:hypothetical protein